MKKLYLETKYCGTIEVFLEISHYVFGNSLYITLNTKMEEEDCMEPWADLTVNLGKEIPEGYAFIDTNNLPYAEEFINKNELGLYTGVMHQSGFCKYPLYMFNIQKLREYDADGVERWQDAAKKSKEG